MMSLLDEITKHEVWMEFLEYKKEKKLLSKSEEEELTEYVYSFSYKTVCDGIADGTYRFGLPEKRSVNKTESTKKRTVFTFDKDENTVLKLICYLLYRYDGVFCDNLYSFRKNKGPKQAFSNIKRLSGLNNRWSIKTDIHDYFNTIDIGLLLPMIKNTFSDDPKLTKFFIDFFNNDRYIENNEVKHSSRGVMAGTPVSVFFANLFLSDMDYFFNERGFDYYRYSDDIIVFCNENEVETVKSMLSDYFCIKKLTINEEKTVITRPGEMFSFLGFSYQNEITDISPITSRKLTAKIRRMARSFYRWRMRKNVDQIKTLRAFNRKLNKKFYSDNLGDELCWARWFFPIINTETTLKAVDRCVQQWERYIVTGKHNKRNYEKVPYSLLKECGYKPLTGQFYSERRDI